MSYCQDNALRHDVIYPRVSYLLERGRFIGITFPATFLPANLELAFRDLGPAFSRQTCFIQAQLTHVQVVLSRHQNNVDAIWVHLKLAPNPLAVEMRKPVTAPLVIVITILVTRPYKWYAEIALWSPRREPWCRSSFCWSACS